MESTLTLGIIITYLAALIIIGFFSSKKIKNTKDFFLANRSLKTFPLTATITATVVGGSATIATAKLIYLNGIPSMWLDIGSAIGLIFLGLFFAQKVRKTGLFTLSEITGKFYDEKVRFAAAILIFITQIAWISLLIQGAGAIIYVLFPYDYTILLTIITLIFILYTILGGQFAVVYTDIIQFIIMIIGVCLIAAPLLFLKAAPDLSTISAGNLSFPINGNIGILSAASFFFMMFMPNIVGPDVYSKLLSAKDEKTAKLGTIYSGIFRAIFAISIGLIAVSAIVLVPGLDASEAVFAMPKSLLVLGPVLSGIVLATFISVILSSADSVLISSTTIFSVDIIKKSNLKMSRIMICIIGVLALLLALYLQDIVDTLQLAYTVFTSGLTLPIIFGFYKEKTKATSKGALLSLILGGAVSLICLYLIESVSSYAVLIGMMFSVLPLLLFRGDKK